MHKIPANTLFMGQNLIFVPECHSTNDLALQYCQQPACPEGTVIITANQTRGRGQRGNGWEAQPGQNLTFSVILKPLFLHIGDQFHLNRITSLAIHDYLKNRTREDVFVKWPNDILINRKKICGILIENQIQGNRFTNVVVGIGLNINQVTFETPTATSLSLATGKEYSLETELEALLGFLEARYLQLKQGNYDLLKTEYLNVMYRRNEPHTFSVGGKNFIGTITGVDAEGRLLIDTADGTKMFGVKEVSFVDG